MSSKSSGGINVVGKRVFASLFSQTSDHDHDKYKLFCLCVLYVCTRFYPAVGGFDPTSTDWNPVPKKYRPLQMRQPFAG